MNLWNDMVVAGGVLLLVFLVWREVVRADRSWLAGRVAATVIAVGALAGMGLVLTLRSDRKVVDAGGGAKDTTGIAAVDWQRRLAKGERLRVEGRWKGGTAKMLLMGMGEVLDSAEAGKGEFLLRAMPAQEGRAVYRLIAVAGADTIEREDIPVEVEAGRPLKILLLASSPDFENKFLMDWLAKGGHEVESRTEVSRGKYAEAFVNMRERGGGFDLEIADSSMVTLRGQVKDGMGLLIRVDSPGAVGKGPGVRVLERDSLGRPVVSCRMEGAGRVAVTTSNMTYREWMAGRHEEYAAWWSNLLREVARQAPVEEVWRMYPALPRVRDQVDLELETDKDWPQGIAGSGTIGSGVVTAGREGKLSGEAAVYLAQDAALPFCWRGCYWPETAGWQQAHSPGGDTSWWYAWPGGSWKGIYGETQSGKPERMIDEKNLIPKAWLYSFFLMSLLFLWVERKIT
jgi:hypothetical protein